MISPTDAKSSQFDVFILKKGSEAPLHIHTLEDETFYVISGSLEARVGDEYFILNEGDSIFLPRGLKHKLVCKSGDAKLLMLIHPPGLEHFFDEIDQAVSEGPVSSEKMKEFSGKYGVEILEE